MKKLIYGSLCAKGAMLALSIAAIFIIPMAIPMEACAAPEVTTEAAAQASASGTASQFYAAAAAVGLGSIAGGAAVAVVGSAALGAVSERPELMGRSLIFLGLAEGICLYGTIIAFMILFK